MGTIKLNKNSVITEEQAVSVINYSTDASVDFVEQAVTEEVGVKEICDLAEKDVGFVEELKELRTTNETVYKRNDRTCRKIITATPTHFIDTDGEYKVISNRLTDNGNEIVNEANSFKVKFDKDVNSGKIFDLKRGNKKVTLSAVSSAKTRGHVCGCKCELCEGSDNTVTATLDDGTEIRYVAMNDRVKENIIIKERLESYEYNFKLDIGDLIVEEGEHNDLLLKDKQTGEAEFRIPAPYMFDSNGNRSNKVSYEIDVNGDELLIKVVADAEYINAEGRAFPVTIDPQIVAYNGELLSYFSEGWAEHNSESDIYEDVIKIYAIDSNTTGVEAYITVHKTKIEIFGAVEKVVLHLQAKAGAQGYMKVLNEIYPLQEKEYVLDITDKYIEAKGDFSINLYGSTLVYGNERSMAEFSNANLIIDYVNRENAYSADNAPAIKQIELNEKAILNLNIKDGTANTVINDGISKNMPFLNLSHIYKASDENFGCGKNMRLNLHRKLNAVIDDKTVTKFIYTDESGDKYILNEKYYYVNASSIPVYVSKADVTVDVDGTLKCKYGKVFVKQTACGYTLISETSGFLNSNVIETRQNEQIQLEEYLKSYERSFLNNLIVVESAVGDKRCNVEEKLTGMSEADLTGFINKTESRSSLIAMQETSLPQFKEACLQCDEYKEKKESAYSELSKAPTNEEKRKAYDEAKKRYENSMEQVDAYITQCKRDFENIKDSFIDCLKKKRELKILLKQTPVNYLRNENGEISGFNRDGDLVLICDSYGNYVNILFDEDNLLTRVYDNKNRCMEFKYANGCLHSITDHLGRRVAYGYDNDNQLKTLTYPDGETLTFEYQSRGIRSIATSNGIQSKFSTDDSKRITTISKNSLPLTIGEEVTIEKSEYNKSLSVLNVEYGIETAGWFTKLTSKENEYEKYVFTGDGRVKKHETCDNCFVKTVKTYTYDANGNVIKTVTQNDLNQTETETLAYDGLGRVIKSESGWLKASDAVKTATEKSYGYDLEGKLIKEVTTVKTDVSGKVTSATEITNYSYNANGGLTLTESYVKGDETTTGKTYEQRIYDENGNVTKIIAWNSLDSTSKFCTESDRAENGQVTADRGESGEVSAEYEYVDGTNVVNSVKYSNGSKFAYGRNPNNFEITGITQSTADGEANSTDIIYSYGLPVKVKSGNTTLGYKYDHTRRKTAVSVNGATQATYSYKDYTYNANQNKCTFGEQTTVLVESSGATTTILQSKTGVLDSASGRIKVTETTKINGTEKYRREYDENGRLKTETDKVANATRNYTYDGYDNVTSISGGGITENYAYNGYGGITEKAYTIGEVTQTYSYAYKNNAARSLDYILFGDYKFKPLTDVYGRNTGREIYSGENKVAAEYVTYRKVGDHATNMPATVWFGSGSEIKDSIKYKYDSCGNICEIRENGHVVAKYAYDGLNRLVREDNKLLNKTVIYTYDSTGNITERCKYAYTTKSGEELDELKCTHYSYDYDGDKLKTYNGETFEYNNIGNPTKYRNKTVAWQYGKMLAKFGDTTFTYDGLGRRTKKGSITFTYDSNGRLIKQSNGLEFVYDVSGIVGVIYGGEQYFYRKDAQGNIIAILDNDGEVVVNYMYDAWGNNEVSGTNATLGALNPFRYRGYYYDTETGWYYLQTRYYDPEVGRFISQDSLEYADPETINGLNLYAYCDNNPVMNVDQFGCSWSSFWSGVGRFLGGAALTVYGFATALFTAIPSIMSPAATVICEFGLTMGFYGVGLVGSIFDSTIYSDMELIGWNPYNSNADAATQSKKLSFYKGVPIIRTYFDRSFTVGIMFLTNGEDANSVRHEFGHIPQLMLLGSGNYLLTVGLPSWKQWGLNKYWTDYFVSPWEAMSEMFGGANSGNAPLTYAEKRRAIRYIIISYFLGPLVHAFYHKL